ncbi:methyltransferase domain-containing protein [Roseomonas gilardii]|uniref:Methyltransferase domain-containing protein n=1 Tax=Roseomonas gilardii TaxID=257708 RepID=A0ABU3MJX1_9PROT|nr:methyltransferase domain-containing protein [Roseomonas gilardii]MDT8332960.1 methyltransferase domain-containing protein [Roseomonas gilardii]
MSAPHQVFDRHLHRLRRDRSAGSLSRVAPILEEAADRLLDRLDDFTLRFDRALDLGGRGVVAPRLRARGVGQVVSMDMSVALARQAGGLPVAGDEEWLPFAENSFDLVVASLSLHWVNDLPGALVQIRRTLRPDGLFLASVPALGTLQNLRESLAAEEEALRGGVSPRVSPFPEVSDGAALLQRAGFALPVADAETLRLAYRSPLALLRDLRAAGETNAVLARDSRPVPRALFPAALARLAGGAAPDEPVPVTLRLLTLTGWAPAPTQQQPARPGSATVRLAEALGTEERSLGEAPPGPRGR